MKKNLHTQTILLVVIAVISSAVSFAQNKIHTTDDQKKFAQLKQYVESHPLANGQTNWAVETLKKYEREFSNPALLKSGNAVNPFSQANRVSGGVPANDDCANSILLTEQTSCVPTSGDVAGSTQSMPPDSCNTYISDSTFDVWYKFVAVTSNPYITVTGSASFDAVVFLFDACGGSILGCSDATINGQPETITALGLTPGNTYYIRVYDYGDAMPATTTFDICVYNAPPPPANDDCANAILLVENATCTSVTGDVSWATESMPPDMCSTFTSAAGYDVWYKFVPATSNPYISVTGSASFDPVVFVLDGCGGSVLACSDTSAGAGTETFGTIGLTIGSTYYIRVYDYGAALPATTTFDICVYTAPVGIAESGQSAIPFLFPNPNNGIFSVKLGSVSEKTTIGIYDVVGKLVQEKIIVNRKEATLDASALTDGVYCVRVQNENGVFTQKIILNK
jgi:hypothetical protein